MAPAASRPELLAIVGETAAGKSELAMRVAKQFSGEIISADSWQVYKGFDIGTSKPSREEQREVKHHLLDVAEASEGFNAPKFKQLAEAAISDIQKRGKLPIMAGGTGLYIDSVLFDFGFLPYTGDERRKILNMLSIAELIALAERQGIDLASIDIRNKRRIIRALEAKGQKPTKKDIKSGVLIIGLQIPREQLRQSVEDRVDQMIRTGLEEEVRQLSKRFGWGIEPMKGIGYGEWRLYFEGKQSLEQTKDRIASATMNLAKRQRTWFRRNPHIHWFGSAEDVYKFIVQNLSN